MTSFDDPSKDQPRDASGQFAATATSPTDTDVLDGDGETLEQVLDSRVSDATFNVKGAMVGVNAFRARDGYVSAKEDDGGSSEEAEAHWNERITAEAEAGNVSREGAARLCFDMPVMGSEGVYTGVASSPLGHTGTRDQYVAEQKVNGVQTRAAQASWDKKIDDLVDGGDLSARRGNAVKFDQSPLELTPVWRNREDGAVGRYRERFIENMGASGRSTQQAIGAWNLHVDNAVHTSDIESYRAANYRLNEANPARLRPITWKHPDPRIGGALPVGERSKFIEEVRGEGVPRIDACDVWNGRVADAVKSGDVLICDAPDFSITPR